jgi:hypothetical protein
VLGGDRRPHLQFNNLVHVVPAKPCGHGDTGTSGPPWERALLHRHAFARRHLTQIALDTWVDTVVGSLQGIDRAQKVRRCGGVGGLEGGIARQGPGWVWRQQHALKGVRHGSVLL